MLLSLLGPCAARWFGYAPHVSEAGIDPDPAASHHGRLLHSERLYRSRRRNRHNHPSSIRKHHGASCWSPARYAACRPSWTARPQFVDVFSIFPELQQVNEKLARVFTRVFCSCMHEASPKFPPNKPNEPHLAKSWSQIPGKVEKTSTNPLPSVQRHKKLATCKHCTCPSPQKNTLQYAQPFRAQCIVQ